MSDGNGEVVGEFFLRGDGEGEAENVGGARDVKEELSR